MIIKLSSILLLITSFGFAGEITKNYNFKDFHKVSIGYGMKAELSQSESFSIVVKADEDDLKYLKVEKDGDNLRFYIDDNYKVSDEINITIKMPSLEELNLSGGSIGNITMDNSSENFEGNLSGGSILKGSLNCGDIDLHLSGGSKITLKGQAGDAGIAGSGGSIFNLKDFTVKDAGVQLSGGSLLEIDMDGILNTAQSGGSQVTYFGNAEIGNTSFSGGSGIKKGN